MANTLTQIGIETGNIVEAYHVSQSIDAFTGAEAYDITLSGSFTVTGSVTINGLTNTAQSNVLTVDTTTGQVYYTASSAIGGGSTINTGSFVTTSSFNSYTGSLSSTFNGTAATSTRLNIIGENSSNDYFTFPFINENSIGNLQVKTNADNDAFKYSPGLSSLKFTGSLNITGSISIKGLSNTAQTNILTIDTASGQLYYTASSAIGGENTFTYEIGQYVPSQGGVIAHRWMSSIALGSPTSGTVQNYLVVSLINQSTNQAWSDVSSTLIGTSAQSTWDGLTNSNAIVAQPGETNSAAALCLAYSTGSINDWYLPSIDELSIIWHNRWAIAQGLIPPGGTSLGTLTYWSSTENDNTTAVPFQFYNGFVGSVQFKSGGLAVRAIRKFNT
jgi:hypothetical protein